MVLFWRFQNVSRGIVEISELSTCEWIINEPLIQLQIICFFFLSVKKMKTVKVANAAVDFGIFGGGAFLWED